MKEIKKLTTDCNKCLVKIESSQLKEKEELKEQIKCIKKYFQQIRSHLRGWEFENKAQEIEFFKHIKPSLEGKLRFYMRKLSYLLERPNTSIDCQKQFLMEKFRHLKKFKKQNNELYKYLKNEETYNDTLYYLRRNAQLSMFSICESPELEFEFNTSHDFMTTKIICFELLSKYYKNELLNLEFQKTTDIQLPKVTKSDLSWTGTKTELIELIYALTLSGSINGGKCNIKEATEVLGEVFNIDLRNFYKTFSDIKNRVSQRTKFIDKLSEKLCNHLELEDHT